MRTPKQNDQQQEQHMKKFADWPRPQSLVEIRRDEIR